MEHIAPDEKANKIRGLHAYVGNASHDPFDNIR